MTDRLNCSLWHEFDGTCCAPDEPCLCEEARNPSAHLDPLRESIVRKTLLNALASGASVAFLALIMFGALQHAEKHYAQLDLRQQEVSR